MAHHQQGTGRQPLPEDLIVVTPERLLTALDAAVGTGEEPDGLCDDTTVHRPHLHDVPGGKRIWCTADRAARAPTSVPVDVCCCGTPRQPHPLGMGRCKR